MMFRITNFDIRTQSEESSSMSLNTKLDDLGFTFHARLDESSGTSAADRINSNSGTIGGSVSLGATGGGVDSNDAVAFTGATGQYLDWSGAAAVDGEVIDNNVRSDRVIFLAFEADVFTGGRILYQQGGESAGLFLYLSTNGNPRINLTNGSGSNFTDLHDALTSGEWYNIIVIQDDSANEVHFLLFDEDGFIDSKVIDITSLTSEALGVQLCSVGAAMGALTGSSANIRNHNDDLWDNTSRIFDGRVDEIAYKASGTITVNEAIELSKSYFLSANTDAPAIANSLTVTQDSNTDNVSADISGWTLAEGDLLIVAATIDGAEAGNTAITQTGFTEHYSTQTSNSLITGCLYSKELASGDTSWTSIDLTWTNNEKAVMRVWRIAAAEHDGIDVVATPNTNDASETPSIPAITLGTNSKAIAIAHLNGSATVDVNPAWYIRDDQTTAAGGGPATQWSGFDELSGSQSADAFTISSAQASVVSVIGIADATGGSSTVAGAGAESVDVTDTSTASLTANASSSETVDIADESTASLTTSPASAETISVSDAATALVGLIGASTESVDISDTATALAMLIASNAEALSISDAATANVILSGAITGEGAETISVSDFASLVAVLVSVSEDGVAISDAATGRLVLGATAEETINISDTSTQSEQGLTGYMTATISTSNQMLGTITINPF